MINTVVKINATSIPCTVASCVSFIFDIVECEAVYCFATIDRIVTLTAVPIAPAMMRKEFIIAVPCETSSDSSAFSPTVLRGITNNPNAIILIV